MLSEDVLWHFEDLKLLQGTDLPIFGGDTYPCLILQLRSMSEPVRVLSGVDYKLDSLMTYVPEVTMWYHSNCFMKKHELVTKKDLPNLNESTCSSKVIKCVAQNILSFLKSNTIKSGHTYWLFKGKNDDIVKLYDLSSLCSESLVEERCKDENLFTIPVAMLLYRVARNLKYNPINKKASNSTSINSLLNNCLKLLNQTKYPHIATTIYFMLSDLYIPFNTNLATPKFEEFIRGGENSPSVDSELKNPQPEAIVMTIEERCKKALCNVGDGLSYLQYLKDINQQLTTRKNVKLIIDESKKAALSVTTPHKAIENVRKMKRYENFNNKGIKNQNQKRDKGIVVIENVDEFKNFFGTSLCKSVDESMPTLYNSSGPQDNLMWKQRLNRLFYEKACLIYVILAENAFTNGKYGKALKYYCLLLKCWMYINNNLHGPIGFLFERSGNCSLLMSQNLDKANQYAIELAIDDKCDLKIRKLLLIKFENCKKKDLKLIPTKIDSKDVMLNAAANCYKRSLELETNKNKKDKMNKIIGNIYCEIASVFIEEISNAWRKKLKIHFSRLQWLIERSLNCLSIGISKLKNTDDLSNLASLYSNMGRLYRYTAFYLEQNKPCTIEFLKNQDFTKMAIDNYKKGLTVLGNRSINKQLWDLIHFDVSTMTFNMAIQYQDHPPKFPNRMEGEKVIIGLLLDALEYCDLENDASKRFYYEFRTADIHDRLGSLYHYRFKYMKTTIQKSKITLDLCTTHYNKSYELFLKMKRPLDCLEVLLKIIAIDEFQIEGARYSHLKVDFYISITKKFDDKCVLVLKMILENKVNNRKENNSTGNVNSNKTDQNSIDQNREKKKKKLLKVLTDRLQQILMSMIKLSIQKLPKLMNKTEQLKSIYLELLRISEANNNYSNLIRVVIQIKDLNL